MPATMTYEDWANRYKPVQNHLDENAGFEGTMFETFGAERDYVWDIAQQNNAKVWTLCEEDGVQFIGSGWHLVNRLGYFITEVEAGEDAPDEVIVDDGSDDEGEGEAADDGYGNPLPVPEHERLRIVTESSTTE
jgi:hypothetical protein